MVGDSKPKLDHGAPAGTASAVGEALSKIAGVSGLTLVDYDDGYAVWGFIDADGVACSVSWSRTQ